MTWCDLTKIRDENAQASASAKFEKGGTYDVSEGPVKKRRCTDVFFLILFVVHAALYLIFNLYGSPDGALYKLVTPRDYSGDYCGRKEQWNNGQDMEAYDYMIYTLNLTKAFDTVAEAFLCNDAMKAKLVPNIVDLSNWTTACAGTLDATSCASVSDCQDKALETYKSYFDLEQIGGMLTGTSSVLKDLTTKFNRACVTGCQVSYTDANSTGRSVIYSPSPDKAWYEVWNKLLGAASNVGISTAAFSMRALSYSDCPYAAQLCVVIPGVAFKELYGGFCTISIDSNMLKNVTSGMGSAMTAVANEATKELSAGLETAFGDIVDAWDTFIITAVIALVLGLTFLVLLRFFVTLVVWGSVLLVFCLFVAGGVALLLYSAKCADDSIVDTVKLAGLLGTDSCAGAYYFAEKTTRTVLAISAYVVWALAVCWLILIAFLCSRIKLAIAINQVAAGFVAQTPHILIVPIVQFFCAMLWTVAWMFFTAFLLSQVPDGYVPKDTYATYAEAHGTSTTAGACTSEYPSGSAYYDPRASTCSSLEATPKCWSCYPPRYNIDYRFWFVLFSFFWNNAFFIALGQCTVAGAVGVWFFARERNASRAASFMSVCTATKNTMVYHLGSLAFGSFILALVQTVRWFMYFVSKQSQAQKNYVAAACAKAAVYCLWCFEKCIKFLNKNAYIQVALLGTNFCTSAKNGFWLVLRNVARFGILGGLGAVIHFIGKAFIVTATTLIGYLILEGMHPDIESPYFMILLYVAVGYFSGALFMNVFGLAVDSILQCFIATEEMGIDSEFIPTGLRGFIQAHEGNEEKSGCCKCF